MYIYIYLSIYQSLSIHLFIYLLIPDTPYMLLIFFQPHTHIRLRFSWRPFKRFPEFSQIVWLYLLVPQNCTHSSSLTFFTKPDKAWDCDPATFKISETQLEREHVTTCALDILVQSCPRDFDCNLLSLPICRRGRGGGVGKLLLHPLPSPPPHTHHPKLILYCIKVQIITHTCWQWRFPAAHDTSHHHDWRKWKGDRLRPKRNATSRLPL